MSLDSSNLKKLKILFWWLKRFIYLWVKSKAFPENTFQNLGLDHRKPICYIFKAQSYLDLLVLDKHCADAGLPRPFYFGPQVNDCDQASLLYLSKRGLWHKNPAENVPTSLLELVRQAKEQNAEVQVVPVSIFWGRNPGREEKSMFKLLFFDEEYGGIWQRIVVFFLHGRQVFCNFSKPILLKDLLTPNTSEEQAAKKLRRLLKIHFRNERDAVLGPPIYDRRQVIETILNSKTIKDAIEREAKRQSISPYKAEMRARKYCHEIAAGLSHHALRFLDRVLTWLWRKIYDGVELKNGEQLRDLAQHYEVVYLPCHRSHMDYLLLGYSLYSLGLLPPHTAAGVNLNFWPAGAILRKGGGFFIRRSFGGDRLYSAVFNEYVHFLLTSGFPMSFYPEGGRSRTGRLLKPKTGMLSMVLHSFRREPRKPVAMVPVYIGYDKLMEGRSYLRELRGKTKQSESLGQLFQARKILKSYYGKAYLSFGEPIFLRDYFETHYPTWREHKNEDERSQELHSMLAPLSKEIMTRINRVSVLAPVALFSIILLSTAKKALAEKELLTVASLLCRILKKAPYSPDATIPEEATMKNLCSYVEKISNIQRFAHPSGDVLYVTEKEGILLTYYRNNVLHLFALPSLIAGFLQHNVALEEEELIQSCQDVYGFIKEELYLTWPEEGIRQTIQIYIKILCEEKLLSKYREGGVDKVQRPDMMAEEFSYFKILGRILAATLERYAIFSLLLSRLEGIDDLEYEKLEVECQLMSQRLGILNGTSEFEFFDKQIFRHYLEKLRHLGHVTLHAGKWTIQPSLEGIAKRSLNILSWDLRQSLLKSTRKSQV